MLENNKETPLIYSVKKTDSKIEGQLFPKQENKFFEVYVPSEDKELVGLLKSNVELFEVAPPQSFWAGIFYSFAPILLFVLFLWYFA